MPHCDLQLLGTQSTLHNLAIAKRTLPIANRNLSTANRNLPTANLGLDMQVPAIMAQGSDGSTEAAGDMGRTARMVTELAETSDELKQYLGANNALLESYSHELLHVQSLAAQLVQMSSMQPLLSHEIL